MEHLVDLVLHREAVEVREHFVEQIDQLPTHPLSLSPLNLNPALRMPSKSPSRCPNPKPETLNCPRQPILMFTP